MAWRRRPFACLALETDKQKVNVPEHGIDYSQISDNIFIGTNMCCQLDFDKELLSKGIEADISLEEDRSDTPFGVNFYLWLPTKDQTSPTKEQTKVGIEAIKNLVDLNKKIYLHCKNGHGRAPTLFAAYLIKEEGMKPEEAIEFIKNKRPVVHLSEAQIKFLKSI